jgi:hypothetical protein
VKISVGLTWLLADWLGQTEIKAFLPTILDAYNPFFQKRGFIVRIVNFIYKKYSCCFLFVLRTRIKVFYALQVRE